MEAKLFPTLLFCLLSFCSSIYSTQGGRLGAVHNKLVQDDGGSVFECVNIYEQPAFEHPLLKNHKIQMKPSSLLKEGENIRNSSRQQYLQTLFKPINCPKGTVPILQARNESGSFAPLTEQYPNQHYAVIRHITDMKFKFPEVFYGSQATIKVLNPAVTENQASMALSSLWIADDMIQAGWGVVPELYGDHKTRFITSWKHGNSGCFDLRCGGFVQVDNKFPLGGALDPSVPGSTVVDLSLSIHMDKLSGNWWLTIPASSINVGYWPGSILPGLANGAAGISWGGLARHHAGMNSPPMGSGSFGSDDRAAYFKDIKVMYRDDTEQRVPASVFEAYTDNSQCYDVRNLEQQDGTGYTITYGGPGGACGS